MAEEATIKVEMALTFDEKAGIHSDTNLITVPTRAFAHLISDLVEEATRRGMEAGIAMMHDSMSDEEEDDEPKFPGFLGETSES